jgi:2-keto-4-pentenoate hydratase/2-oxohepta-3-ene-1,7-dioic acid hydratase in catechol pathway
MGPCIATADEIPFPPVLNIASTVNGELRQSSTTALLITGVAEIIGVLSQGMTLRAGTIISTGTPSGVGMGFQPPKFLKLGDVVSCIVEGIGSLTNTVSE